MIVVCAWCNDALRMIEPLNDDKVSHGICAECKDKVLNRVPTHARIVEIEVVDTVWGPLDIGGEA